MNEGNKISSRLLSSEIKRNILELFNKNPGLIDVEEGIARKIGRSKEAVSADLNDLIDIGILQNKRIGLSNLIFLNKEREKEVQEAIKNYSKGTKKGEDA
jgi:predicted transcriptional regulator